MEKGKKPRSSIVSDLFGEKDSLKTGAPSRIFDSIFAPPPKVYGRDSIHSSASNEKKDGNGVGVEDQNQGGSTNNDVTYYHDEKAHPFHYSSSIYYGGQDFYNRPPQPPKNPVFTTFNKDGGEDDSAGASRGNWWQGSLYY